MLRTEAGRNPYDKELTDLVGELSTRSDAFRVRWGAHDVRLHRTGRKHIHHPVVGVLHLSYEVMDLPGDPGLALVAYSADSGTPADDAVTVPCQLGRHPRPSRRPGDAEPNVIPQARPADALGTTIGGRNPPGEGRSETGDPHGRNPLTKGKFS